MNCRPSLGMKRLVKRLLNRVMEKKLPHFTLASIEQARIDSGDRVLLKLRCYLNTRMVQMVQNLSEIDCNKDQDVFENNPTELRK